MSLQELYSKCKKIYDEIEAGETVDLAESITLIMDTIELVDKNSLISKNEELDEIQTSTLKYLDLYYFLAKVHYSVPDLGIKRNHLQSAVKYYKIFIQKCLLLKIVKEKDLVELGLMSNDEAEASEAGNTTIFNHMVDHVSTGGTMKMTHDLEKKRIHKIAKYKREKEIKQKINGLRRVIYIAKKSQADSGSGATTSSITASNLNDSVMEQSGSEVSGVKSSYIGEHDVLGDDFGDCETEMRELSILLLQTHVYSSFDDISSAEQEMEMLQHMDRLDEDARVNSRNTSTNMTGREMQEQVQKFGRVLPGNLLSGTVEHSKGIEVTHVYKEFSGKILTERERIHKEVFTPKMSAPHMTIEEFGELEAARMAAEEEARKNAPAQPEGPRKYNELLEAGLEDNTKLVDEGIHKDREWDEWKEANPKGSGNKANKRF